jgi:predicted metal-dependent hydrolase
MTLFDDVIQIDELVRSKRRTISIIINKDAKITVRAPLKASVNDINLFVLEKRDWINRKKTEILEKKKKIKEKFFVTGEKFYYLGKAYPLKLISGFDFAFNFDGEVFSMDSKYRSSAKRLFSVWYKSQAEIFLPIRINEISLRTGLNFNQIKINGANKRWGSCNSKKVINLTWRLILLPEFIIDYIIIHELSHTKHLNHSDRFWDLVLQHCPDYKKAEKWLNKSSDMYQI